MCGRTIAVSFTPTRLTHRAWSVATLRAAHHVCFPKTDTGPASSACLINVRGDSQTLRLTRSRLQKVLPFSRDIDRETACYSQCGNFVVFQSDFLRKHNVSCHQVARGQEAPANAGIAFFVNLKNVRGRTVSDAIPLPCIATNDKEGPRFFELRALFWR